MCVRNISACIPRQQVPKSTAVMMFCLTSMGKIKLTKECFARLSEYRAYMHMLRQYRTDQKKQRHDDVRVFVRLYNEAALDENVFKLTMLAQTLPDRKHYTLTDFEIPRAQKDCDAAGDILKFIEDEPLVPITVGVLMTASNDWAVVQTPTAINSMLQDLSFMRSADA